MLSKLFRARASIKKIPKATNKAAKKYAQKLNLFFHNFACFFA
jgi:hypothetical protein